ncbi:hypothetical protein GCK32_010528 [Trichostrongylus colubriformis]|uniref:Uncharacterized protein n=1 Tax=Trichostrongylus colubriformis TaxID=6319 RepID=A0AAN8INN7_TRICO
MDIPATEVGFEVMFPFILLLILFINGHEAKYVLTIHVGWMLFCRRRASEPLAERPSYGGCIWSDVSHKMWLCGASC